MKKLDIVLLSAVFLLLFFGMLIIFDASSFIAFRDFGDKYHYIKDQAMWLVIGLTALTFFTFFDYHKFYGLSLPLLIVPSACRICKINACDISCSVVFHQGERQVACILWAFGFCYASCYARAGYGNGNDYFLRMYCALFLRGRKDYIFSLYCSSCCIDRFYSCKNRAISCSKTCNISQF